MMIDDKVGGDDLQRFIDTGEFGAAKSGSSGATYDPAIRQAIGEAIQKSFGTPNHKTEEPPNVEPYTVILPNGRELETVINPAMIPPAWKLKNDNHV